MRKTKVRRDYFEIAKNWFHVLIYFVKLLLSCGYKVLIHAFIVLVTWVEANANELIR